MRELLWRITITTAAGLAVNVIVRAYDNGTLKGFRVRLVGRALGVR